MYASKVFAAITVVGFASAATSTIASACSQATVTVAAQADVAAISGCPTLTGDLVIASTAAGTISIDGVEQIQGNFIAKNISQVSSLGAPSLNSIGKAFTLNGLTILSNLAFPELTSVGSIEFINLPELQQLTFTSTITEAPNVNIQDTQLSSLNGINLATVDTMVISNNRFLTTISTQVSNVTGSLEIDSNGQALMIELPNLKSSIGDLTFRNASGVSIPSLATVNGTLSFLFNTMTDLAAPNLTMATGIAISANSALSNLSMPMLTTIGGGGITVQNNTELVDIESFPQLKTISGALDFLGNFTTLDMPKLGRVGGSFIAISSGNFSCDSFDKLHSEGEVLSTVYHCTPTSDNVNDNGTSTSSGSSSGSGTSTGSSASSTSTKKGAAVTLNAAPTIAFGLVAAVFALLL